MALSIEIVSPTKILYSGEATEVVAPSVKGEVGLLPMHADYMTLLAQGNIEIKNGTQTKTFSITGGVAKIEKDKLLVLVEETSGIQ